MEASIPGCSAPPQAGGANRPLAACTYPPRAARPLADYEAPTARFRGIPASKADPRRVGGAEKVWHHTTRGRDSGPRRTSGERGPCHENAAGAVDVVAASNRAGTYKNGSAAATSRLHLDAH